MSKLTIKQLQQSDAQLMQTAEQIYTKMTTETTLFETISYFSLNSILLNYS